MTNADDGQQPTDDSGVGGDAGASDGADAGAGSTTPAPIPSSPSLESLASRYEPEQHATYLRHLQEAVEKPQNLNVALTGRYGTGKSSVLDKFESKYKDQTLRLAISTLGPNLEGVSLTNRIQKELVKQLLYRAAPRKFPFSRFNRIVPLSRKRAAGEACVAVAVVGFLLWFLGWLPAVAGTGSGHQALLRVLSWIGFAALVVVVLTGLRLVIYGRFVVSDVSAAGATVKLTQRTSTYFDEYLEEIVYFFDEVFPDFVIFEDLDRFDDPHIFEALRELNTLLNNTDKRLKKRKPLRFLYAIKDSLFERLGSESEKSQDAAAAETVRANRTKFFDVVIPLVPFISHRNARELLVDLIKAGGFTDIDRSLIGLVAQHATDMRLLRNICNEYAVFAERLLTSDKIAPGLTPSNLFALVIYKNFHLKDFEEISRRNSNLDVLYDRHRELVRAAIDACEKRKRDLLKEPNRYKSMASLIKRLGDQLVAIGMIFKNSAGYAHWPHLRFSINSARHAQGDVNSYPFWNAVAEAGTVSVLAATEPEGGQQHVVGTLDRIQINTFFPEASDANQWVEIDAIRNEEALDSLNQDISFLRGADFQELAAEISFTLSTEDGDGTFASIVDTAMKSQLARDLVKKGYLDQNFALYAAQFYGDFTGVDVANFIVQAVQPNLMDIYYRFSGPEAIANLLAETPEDFTRTVSAYNIELLDYLLEQNDFDATHIADTIASDFGADTKDFLTAYLNSGLQREPFVALLSKRPWLGVFTYLVQDEGVPADVRPALVDAALHSVDGGDAYELGPEVRDFIIANYSGMAVFTSHQNDAVADKVVALIKKAGVVIPALAGLDEVIRVRIVREHLYHLTADNLREALGVTGAVSLDQVRGNEDVYDLCRQKPNEYLTAVENDTDTPYSVLTETTLADVLAEVTEVWDTDKIRELIAMAAPESRLERVDAAPESFWPDLAAQHLFRSTVRNVRTYRDTIGSIDQNLASLLVQVGSIYDGGDDEAVQMSVAVDVLNAVDTIPEARQRVSLVASLDLHHHVSPSEIEPEAGDFLALLLERDLVEDSLDSFVQFRSAGWGVIEAAIANSAKFVEFMTPELVSDFIKDLLGSHVVPRQARDRVVDNLAQYVPNDNSAALSAAGRYALTRDRPLPLGQVLRVAAATRDKNLTLRLLAVGSPMPPASEVVAVLTELGEPYSYLTNRTKDEFEVPADEEHRAVFNHLKEASLISEFKKRRMKDIFIVKMA